VKATPADAAELLTLQLACGVQEAVANDFLGMPPLLESVDDRVLLEHAEAARPAGATAYRLFTGAASEANLRRYKRAGYRVVGSDDTYGFPGVELGKPVRRKRR
jgi:tRNA (guanine37-N1)-methyltransferase